MGTDRSSTPAALSDLRADAVQRGVSLPVYLLARAVLVPFFRVYLRLEGLGGADMPRKGPLLVAANHRSFLDPFVICALMRRPIYYVAKRELFERRWQAWVLNRLGAFPIDRGRGDCVLIFPEGTRVRPGPLGAPRRGVGRLALETGAPVVPVAVMGSDLVRRGWRIRPRKVRVRFGRTMSFPRAEEVLPSLAAGATSSIWSAIALQWQWLGGEAPEGSAAARPERVPARM